MERNLTAVSSYREKMKAFPYLDWELTDCTNIVESLKRNLENFYDFLETLSKEEWRELLISLILQDNCRANDTHNLLFRLVYSSKGYPTITVSERLGLLLPQQLKMITDICNELLNEFIDKALQGDEESLYQLNSLANICGWVAPFGISLEKGRVCDIILNESTASKSFLSICVKVARMTRGGSTYVSSRFWKKLSPDRFSWAPYCLLDVLADEGNYEECFNLLSSLPDPEVLGNWDEGRKMVYLLFEKKSFKRFVKKESERYDFEEKIKGWPEWMKKIKKDLVYYTPELEIL